jgi:hypothetical protein
MKKILKITSSLLIGIVVLYSVLWFATTTFIKNQLIKEIEQLKSEEILISYDNNIAVSGYPSKVIFTFSALKINYKKNIGFDLTSDSLILTSDLLFNHLNFAFGDNTIFKSAKASFIYDEKNAPSVMLDFLKPMIVAMNPKILKDLWRDISFVSYNDSGFTVIDNIEDKKVLIIDCTNLVLNREKKDNKINNIVSAKSSWQDVDSKFNPVTLLANFSVLMDHGQNKQPVSSINIEKISIKSDQASIAIDGGFNKNDASDNLVGAVNIALNNYDTMLDFLGNNKLIEDKVAVKLLLQKIADVDHQALDINFAIKYDGKSDLTIGNMNIASLIIAYYQR